MECNLVKIPNVFDLSKKQIQTLPIVPGTRITDLVRMAGFGPSVVVIRNGVIEENLDAWIMPGDVVHVFPRLQNDVIKTVATIALVAMVSYYAPGAGAGLAGMFGGSVAMWSGMFTVVTLTAGGLLINSLMPPPAVPESSTSFGSQISDSPTYGWQIASNPTEEGRAIPVVYGNERSLSQVINRYLEIDSAGDQWAHILLCVAEGLTNNIPTEDDIYVGEELLSFYEPSDYDLYATDGGGSPDTGQLVKFQKLHQYRAVQKHVMADHTVSLCHFNGTEGSTTIVDEAIFDANWTCYNNADLKTTNPWKGTANLDVLGATDYVWITDVLHEWNIMMEETWDMEFRFRQPTLQNAGTVGQYLDLRGYPDYGYDYEMFWSVIYDHTNTRLVFQQFKVESSSYTIYFNVTGTVSLSVDTWHHFRICRSGDTVYLFLEGTLVGSGAYSTAPTAPGYTGTWRQYMGRAYWYDSVGPSYTLTYAQAEIDEFQFKVGALIYDSLAGFTPAADEAPSPQLGIYAATKGKVDELSFIIEATYGLYWTSAADGSLHALGIKFDFMYRKVGDSAWTTQSVTLSGNSRYPVREQWTCTMPERAQYEIRVVRKTANFTASPWAARTYWTGLDEILDEFLSYPYLQLVSVSLRAQDELSGNVPTIRVVNNRTSIEVPNFNGSGTMIVDPTNNAYAAYDMLISDLYGGGVDPTRFDADAWQDWIDWCDGLVEGNKRCQFNMILDANYDMDTALQHAENAGRAKIVMRGTQISVVIEKPESPSFLFSSGNLKSSKLTWLPQAERSDAVEISYRDKNKLWQDSKAFHPSAGYETLNRIQKIVKINLPGVNNYEQAMREAILRQQISENIKRAVTLESGIESIMSTVGDVVRFAHEGNAMVAGGRLAADSPGGPIRIDKKITLDSATFSGNCKIWIKTADDTILEGTVTGPFDEETDTFSTSISSAVERFDNYIIGRSSGEKYLYRLVSAKRNSNQEVAFTGLQYVESSYYHEDYGSGAVAI